MMKSEAESLALSLLRLRDEGVEERVSQMQRDLIPMSWRLLTELMVVEAVVAYMAKAS